MDLKLFLLSLSSKPLLSANLASSSAVLVSTSPCTRLNASSPAATSSSMITILCVRKGSLRTVRDFGFSLISSIAPMLTSCRCNSYVPYLVGSQEDVPKSIICCFTRNAYREAIVVLDQGAVHEVEGDELRSGGGCGCGCFAFGCRYVGLRRRAHRWSQYSWL